MNTETVSQIKSLKSEDTFAIGVKFGKACRGGELFVLSSDLGGGKTVFTKGLASGLGSKDIVSSPTFTVSNIYKCRDDIEIYHYDFYRLNEGGVVASELREILEDPQIVVVVEWGDIVSDSLPNKRVDVRIARVSSGEDHRLIDISINSDLTYLEEYL